MNTDLISTLLEAVKDGAVPLPVTGESVDDFRFRAAHAGALVALKWMSDQAMAQHEANAVAAAEAAAFAEAQEGRHGDATVTSLPVMPPSQNESVGV